MTEQITEGGKETEVTTDVNLETPEGGELENQPVEPELEIEAAAASTDDDLEPEGDGKPPKDGVQQRIDKLTREKKEAQEGRAAADAAANYYRGLADAGGLKPAGPGAEPEPEKIRTLEEFDFDQDAYLEYRLALQAKDIDQKIQAGQKTDQANRSAANIQTQYKDMAAKHEDFQETIANPQMYVNQDMLNAINPDMLGEVAYHFGKHPQESVRISRLPAHEQIKAIGAIEVQIKNRPAPKKKTTNTEPPPEHQAGSGASAPKKPLSEMSQKDLVRQWDIERVVKLTGCTPEQAAAQI